LKAVPNNIEPDHHFLILGEWFHTGCSDTNQAGNHEMGIRDIKLSIVQGSSRASVGSVASSGTHFSFTLPTELPDSFKPGPAKIVAQWSDHDQYPASPVATPVVIS
jgi:hypothetical protein